MLILTRRIGESLIVGDREAVITVLGVKGNQVRIGVKADEEMVVDREEIYLRKQQERKQLEHDDRKSVKAHSALKRFAHSITGHRPR